MSSQPKRKAGGGSFSSSAKKRSKESASSPFSSSSSSFSKFINSLSMEDFSLLFSMSQYLLYALGALMILTVPLLFARFVSAMGFLGKWSSRQRQRGALASLLSLPSLLSSSAANSGATTPSEVFALRCKLVNDVNKAQHPLRIMVVLGSGGHTSEMFQTLLLLLGDAPPSSSSPITSPTTPQQAKQNMNANSTNTNTSRLDSTLQGWGNKWTQHRCVYIVSDNDKDSANAAHVFERSERCKRFATIRRIPRARNVGQSYLSSIKTTLYAMIKCFSIVFEEAPNVILTNGPGVCIPIVFCAIVIGAFYSPFSGLVGYFKGGNRWLGRRRALAMLKSDGEVGEGGTNQKEGSSSSTASSAVSSPIASKNTINSFDEIPTECGGGSAGGKGGNRKGAGGSSMARFVDGSVCPSLFDAIASVFASFLSDLFPSSSSFSSASSLRFITHQRPLIAYFESFTCVDRLSLTGKLLTKLMVADVFTVQWPQLLGLGGAVAASANTEEKEGSNTQEKKKGRAPSSSSFVLAGPFAHFPANQTAEPARPSSEYLSFIRSGRGDGDGAAAAIAGGGERGRSVLVTVGSTKFDDLIAAVTSHCFLASLQRAGVSTLFIQMGRTDAAVASKLFSTERLAVKGGKEENGQTQPAAETTTTSNPSSSPFAPFTDFVKSRYGITVDIFDYKPNMSAVFLSRRSLRKTAGGGGGGQGSAAAPAKPLSTTPIDFLISHAGAGTILEAFAHAVPTIVVPNERLMNNHQLLFAEELARRGHLLRCAKLNTAVTTPTTQNGGDKAVGGAAAEGEEGCGLAACVDRLVEACALVNDDDGNVSSDPQGRNRLHAFPQPNKAIVNVLFDYLVGLDETE